jgi:hypothetical protein
MISWISEKKLLKAELEFGPRPRLNFFSHAVMSCILQLAGCFSGKDTRAMATRTRLPFLGSGGPCSTSTGAPLVPKANTSLPMGGFNGQRLQHGGLDLQILGDVPPIKIIEHPYHP